jgi:hypothetical protein
MLAGRCRWLPILERWLQPRSTGTEEENAERPTSNAQSQIQSRLSSFCVFLGRPNARHENPDKFFDFGETGAELAGMNELKAADQTEPAPGLAQLLEANPKFVQEILSRFRRFDFAVVREWRSPATKQLTCDMIARFGIGKPVC